MRSSVYCGAPLVAHLTACPRCHREDAVPAPPPAASPTEAAASGQPVQWLETNMSDRPVERDDPNDVRLMFLIGVIGSIVVLTDHLVSNADGTWGVVQAVLFGLFGGTVVGLFIGFALVMAWWSV